MDPVHPLVAASPTPTRSAPAGSRSRSAPQHGPLAQAAFALGLYGLVSLLCFGWAILPHLGRVCACVNNAAGDPSGYMWNLAWWAHALTHAQDPFSSAAVFAPSHTALGGEGMLIPGPAIVLTPVTLLFGPLVAYNVIMLASPVLAAFFAFLLCRYVTERFAPSLVGGLVFGFSAYMLGHLAGHANLVLVFPIPAAVHLTLALIDGRISRGRYLALAGLTLAALLSCTTELALTLVGFGTAALLVAAVTVPPARTSIVQAGPAVIAAGLLGVLLASPIILAGLRDNSASSFIGNGDLFGGDLFGYLIPTRPFWLGRGLWSGFAAPFTDGDVFESGLYLGVPLTFVVLAYLIAERRAPSTRVMAAMLVLIGILTLGSHLHVDGEATAIPLPWLWFSHSSFLNEIVPARFGVYTFLLAAIIVARWLTLAPPGRAGAASWIAILLALTLITPDVGSDLWHSRPQNPPFFSTNEYRHTLRHGENVLMLPDPETTDSMLWQAETGMWFDQAGGYLGRFSTPAGYARTTFAQQADPTARALAAFVRVRSVDAIILDPQLAGRWPEVLASLHLHGRRLGGVVVYDTLSGRTRSAPGRRRRDRRR
jgi:hypothetical protein